MFQNTSGIRWKKLIFLHGFCHCCGPSPPCLDWLGERERGEMEPGEWVGEVVSRGGEGIDIGRLFRNPGRESAARGGGVIEYESYIRRINTEDKAVNIPRNLNSMTGFCACLLE